MFNVQRRVGLLGDDHSQYSQAEVDTQKMVRNHHLMIIGLPLLATTMAFPSNVQNVHYYRYFLPEKYPTSFISNIMLFLFCFGVCFCFRSLGVCLFFCLWFCFCLVSPSHVSMDKTW